MMKMASYFLMLQEDVARQLFQMFLIAGICHESKVVFSTAASGIAAILLQNGTTSHKQFKFPIPIFEESTCSIPLQSPQAHQL